MAQGTNERWAPIPGAPNYEVSTLGRVRSLPRITQRNGKPLSVPGGILLTPPRKGYPRFNALVDKRPIQMFVHQCVMLAFVGPPPARHEVRHLNGDRADNRLENLTYGTRIENIRDAKTHGTLKHESLHPFAKLTEAQVRMILRDKRSAREVAEQYGITPGYVYVLKRGVNWKSIPRTTKVIRYKPGNRKLTERQVRTIRASNLTLNVLAAQFDVDRNTIWRIKNNLSWKHVI